MKTIWKSHTQRLLRLEGPLRAVVQRVGPVRMESAAPPFETLATSILSQQLAGAAARTIIRRVSELSPPFPTPQFFESTKLEVLRTVGVSGQKANYLQSLAIHWKRRAWRSGWDKLADEALIERLVEVKGIGVWTAQMYLIFGLFRPNVLPVGDLGIQKGIQRLYALRDLPSPVQVQTHAAAWEGSYSAASWYLWRAIEGG